MGKKRYYKRSVNFLFAVKNFFKNNKILIISLCVVVLLGIVMGVLVAIKSKITIDNLANFDLSIIYCDGNLEFQGVVERFKSCLINVLLLSLASIHVLLLPLSYVVIAYRAYLLGFNLALMVCLFGVGGAISSILVILPCQLVVLALEIVYTVIMVSISDSKKRYGRANCSFLKVLLICLILLLVVCLIESFLLEVFSADTILVI